MGFSKLRRERGLSMVEVAFAIAIVSIFLAIIAVSINYMRREIFLHGVRNVMVNYEYAIRGAMIQMLSAPEMFDPSNANGFEAIKNNLKEVDNSYYVEHQECWGNLDASSDCKTEWMDYTCDPKDSLDLAILESWSIDDRFRCYLIDRLPPSKMEYFDRIVEKLSFEYVPYEPFSSTHIGFSSLNRTTSVLRVKLTIKVRDPVSKHFISYDVVISEGNRE